MRACRTDRLDIVKVLVMNGANIHAVNKVGLSVLSLANRAGHKEIIAFLTTLGLKD